jgi:hypothetical protein
MTKELDRNQMEEILIAHEKAELEGDLEATLATLTPEPQYELASLGWAINGMNAVRETYQRILPGAQKWDIAAEARGYTWGENTLVREAHVSFNTVDGERVTGLYMVVMAFDPELKRISGERMYMDPLFAKLMATDLGADFGDLPGVSRISQTAPIIQIHDAFAAAAARGITIESNRAASS